MTSHLTPPVLLTDTDLAGLPAADAVQWMAEALLARSGGQLMSPPRAAASMGEWRVVLTAGRGDGWYGYRVYDTLPTADAEQVVVAHDGATGRVTAIHTGTALGALRTGALGGVAARHLAPAGPVRVAVVGAGAQAWTQLWAIASQTDVREVRAASRTTISREAFAARARRELALAATAVDDVRTAVAGAEVVVLATTSAAPVIESAWLAPDVLVHTVGPKQVSRAEFPLDLVSGADLVVTDSPDQLCAYDPPSQVAAARLDGAVVDLADVVTGHHVGRRHGRRVYLSVGLAGTEPYLLSRLAAARVSDGR